MITLCPDCQTRFRLPLDQVASSRGEVFCGECHAQFNALDHLVIEEGIKQNRPTLTDRAQKGDEGERENTLFLPIDENAIANLLSEGSALKVDADRPSQPEKKLETIDESPKLAPIAQSSVPDFTDTLIQRALQAEEHTQKEAGLDQDNTGNGDAIHQEEILRHRDIQGAVQKAPQQGSHETTDTLTHDTPPPDREPAKYRLNPDLEESSQAHSSPIWASLLSIAAILLLLSTIGLQYLVAQREHFSQHRYFRPLLTTICPHIGCVMPPRRKLALLSIGDNRIETHPQFPEALLITAELANNGLFEQNYPIVELIMTNIQQEVVASRRFYPNEYLPEPSNRTTRYFAASSREQLELEVVDPGSHATGFEFILHNSL